MTTQAMQVMAKAFEASAFKGDTLKGTIADGGAIWLAARELFPDCVWSACGQVDFADGSAIEYIRDPSSMFNTTYKAVAPLVTVEAKVSPNPSQVMFHFRVFPEGDVIALWNDEHDRPGLMSSYQHIGQHGDASKELLTQLRKATVGESQPLVVELASIGYRVLDADEWERGTIHEYNQMSKQELETECERLQTMQHEYAKRGLSVMASKYAGKLVTATLILANKE